MTENSLAVLGTGLGLMMDLQALDNPRPAFVPQPARPTPTWREESAPEARREAALRWIVCCAPRPWPHERRDRLELLAADAGTPDRDAAPANVRWVRATSTALTLWRPDSRDFFGADGCQLNGLYGFMESVVWPLWVNEYASQRLSLEADLPTVTAAALNRHLQHQDAIREAIRRSIADLLARHPRARALYAAVDNEDVPRLRRYQWAWMRFRLGIEPQYLAEYLTFIADGDTAKVGHRKFYLLYSILSQVLRDRIERGQVAWHHPDYDRLRANDSTEHARISHAAKHYYADAFRQFCLSDDMLELERELFADTRYPRSWPYQELIEELAATHRPLSVERQLNRG